jgi:D-inositol-3-phosphate glycosyltransferase
MTQNIQIEGERSQAEEMHTMADSGAAPRFSVTVLTGGSDRPYVYGLTKALCSVGATLDVIGSDELDEPELRNRPGVRFLNLRGDQRPDVGLIAKIHRVLAYYWKLIRYAATAKPKIFHILWNSKFETFDRTLLMLYYKWLGKVVVLTVHNVNQRRRDSNDTILNRFTLRFQYQLANHIFVHTEKMKGELMRGFGVPSRRITVIPFGINNSVPETSLSYREAKERLGLSQNQKTILFFGRIAPYKGLEYLVTAFERLAHQHNDYRLIIAGRLEKGTEGYWESIKKEINEYVESGRILLRIEFIPDGETEVYFKGCDVLVLPYREIFQSGVIFLGFNFGLPVIAADVGSLKEEILEGVTGFTFKSGDPIDLARALEDYFASALFSNLEKRRKEIREFAVKRHSWEAVSEMTTGVYAYLLRGKSRIPSDAANLSPSD